MRVDSEAGDALEWIRLDHALAYAQCESRLYSWLETFEEDFICLHSGCCDMRNL